MDNCVFALKRLLRLIDVKTSDEYLEESILSNPEYPSLLALSDCLNELQIQNIALQTKIERLKSFPMPCIVQIHQNGETPFAVLKSIENNKITFYDASGTLNTFIQEEFQRIWTGVCLLIEKSENSKQPIVRNKNRHNVLIKATGISIGVLSIIWFAQGFSDSQIVQNSSTIWYYVAYFIFKIFGLALGLTLLFFEVNKYNPTLQNFCAGGKRVNCNAVLDSEHANLFNGTMNLSLLSFAYFFGTLFILPLTNFSFSSFSIVSFLSYTSLFMIIPSLYYQGVVIKQWCKFCIAIKIVLLFEIAISYIGKLYVKPVNIDSLPLLGILFLIPIISWTFLKHLFEKEKSGKLYKRTLSRIKGNKGVFNGLLEKSNKIINSPQDIGIIIKNEKAKNSVLMVCSPNCNPCAEAFPIFEKLSSQNKINFQIIFTANNDQLSEDGKIVRHFLAIFDKEKDSNKALNKSLVEWYQMQKKEYQLFAQTYPLNGELTQQYEKVDKMFAWCVSQGISHTPTIFINNRELPREYAIKDLETILS